MENLTDLERKENAMNFIKNLRESENWNIFVTRNYFVGLLRELKNSRAEIDSITNTLFCVNIYIEDLQLVYVPKKEIIIVSGRDEIALATLDVKEDLTVAIIKSWVAILGK